MIILICEKSVYLSLIPHYEFSISHILLLYYININGIQTLAEGAMIGHTPTGMQVAQETLVILSFWFCCIV
jgi:hypothetical protein